ncbi:hypothetical protein [Brachyspira catarrhinii]|uniref:Cell surface protein n=1 Tax=Brachyspira catarrhinii TaxID=2528966 RepID=A0ABY2TU46_9SPIR|nr:hypothetical protein [Brachyspira catarrhinii]TKZ35412.1 hypothetical protein EZH24_05430 [Brachyspira catarrhinii]
MKKIINILILTFITFAYSFAQISTNMQTMIGNLDLSARKRATAGEFSRDSDNLNAKNVFDLDRIIFSAGYVPNLNSSSNQVIQAFFGIPILNNAMYFGLAGAYAMSETRSDYANSTTTALTTPNYLGKRVTTASSFAIRPVFKINDMISIHYLIARGGVKSSTNGYTSYTDGDNFRVITNSLANTEWVHEVAVGLKFGEMKLKIPLRFHIDNNSYLKTYSREISGNFVNDLNYGNSEHIEAGTNANSSSPVKMILAPEFYMPLVSGPMTGINAGLTLGFDIYNPNKKTSYYTNDRNETKSAGATTRNTVNSSAITEREKIFGMEFDINAYPTLEWNLSDNRVQLIMEPKVGLSVSVSNVGQTTTTTKYDVSTYVGNPDGTTIETYNNYETSTITGNKVSTVTTTPYVELPIGTVFTPVNWFEFRAGLSYRLGFEMTNTSTEYLQGGKSKTFGYNFTSSMDLFTGIGFIIGQDFFIDLFLVAGTEFAGASTVKSIFDIDAWGAQLSYRL